MVSATTTTAAEGNTDGGPRDPGGPAVGPEPLVVDAHRAPPRAGVLPPRGARQQQAPGGARHVPPRDDDDDANVDDGGDDAGPVGGLGLLQDKGHEARDQGGSPAAAVAPRGEHPRRREPDELPGVRRRAQLHDAHAVGVRQGAGAGTAAAAAAEGGPGEAQVLVRSGPEHRELAQEPVLEGRRRPDVVEGGHAGGVGGRRAAPVDAVDQRAQHGLHRVHAGRARQEALQVDIYTCRTHRCLHCILLLLPSPFDAFVLGICTYVIGGVACCGLPLRLLVRCALLELSGCWLLCPQPSFGLVFEGPVSCSV